MSAPRKDGLPSPAYLRERLRYEPETGKLFWRYYEPHGPQWNARWPGREAFTSTNTAGYRCGDIDNHSHRAHRVIWAMVHDAWPEYEVDHEDHDRQNNRLVNLRSVGPTGNNRNSLMQHDNTSGVTGVCWDTPRRKWAAYINVDHQRLFLGRFDDFDIAVAARRLAEIEHDFHPSHGKRT